MPKVKTHSGAKKRIKVTGTGKLKRKHAFKRHNLDKQKRSTKQKRFLTNMTLVNDADVPRLKKLLNI